MRKLFIFFGVLVCLCLTVQLGHAADPMEAHEAGFGPEIRGLRLGNAMTLPEMVNTQANILKAKPEPKPWVPGTPLPVTVPTLFIFGLVVADNYKAIDYHDDSPSKPGNWIIVNFSSTHGPLIMNGSGGIIHSEAPKSGTLDELFAFLKKNGLNYASTPNLMLRDERVIQYSLGKDRLFVDTTTAAQLAQWVKTTCSLEKMEPAGEHYEASNELEGWRVVVTDDTVTVFAIPTPDSPQ